jgi:hypothetical protein
VTKEKNAKNIRIGIYSFGILSLWLAVQLPMLSVIGGSVYPVISLLVATVLAALLFYFLFLMGLMPRYISFLLRSDILTHEQKSALDLFPRVEEV